ncbi:MAG: putative Ribonuclease VapC1 [Candidatus Thorarchaeota archaeon]|nr:MAG: putative Ribonuclease VapC1 [Candidatus Thorarchaeota archaeon]
MILLDTSFVIDLMRGNTDCMKLLQDTEAREEDVFLSTISVYELLVGVAHADNKIDEEQKIRESLSAITTIDFDKYSSYESGTIYSELKSQGSMINSFDILIAGIARRHNYSVMTRNGSDFNRINGLQVIEY